MISESIDIPRERLDDRIANGPPHLRPILLAVRDHGVGLAVVPQCRDTFELPTARPHVVIIGDDLHEALGPTAFDRLSLKRVVRRAGAAIVVSSSPEFLPYATAAGIALLGRDVVLVETLPAFELEWIHYIERYRPGILRLISTPYPEGRPQ